MGSVASWLVESFHIRDRTLVPCIDRSILIQWATRRVLKYIFKQNFEQWKLLADLELAGWGLWRKNKQMLESPNKRKERMWLRREISTCTVWEMVGFSYLFYFLFSRQPEDIVELFTGIKKKKKKNLPLFIPNTYSMFWLQDFGTNPLTIS